MIDFKCSNCGEGLEAPISMAGLAVQCPKCGMDEEVPDPEGDQPVVIDIDEDEKPPIPLDDSPGAGFEGTSQIRSFQSEAEGRKVEQQLKRPLNITGQGATRVKTFHVRLSDNAMGYLDEMINEWLDNHPDFEVKFSNTTVGIVEGKKSEPHLIMTIWY